MGNYLKMSTSTPRVLQASGGTHAALGAVLDPLIEKRLHGLEGLGIDQRGWGGGCQPSRQGTWSS